MNEMARPITDISVYRYFFETQGMKVKEAISALLKKDSLNDGDIQAVKGLVELYEALAHVDAYMVEVNRLRGNGAQRQEGCSILNYAIEIGRRLEEAKAMLPHGEWGAWLKRELGYSQSTAQNFMRVFREYGDSQQSLFGRAPKSQTFGNLTYSKALRLLAIRPW